MILFESPAASVFQKNAVKLQICFMDYISTGLSISMSGVDLILYLSQVKVSSRLSRQ